MQAIDRGQFLRLGALGAGSALAGGMLGAAPASAALPTPAPQGDDLGFVQLGAVGERISLAYYRAARHARPLMRAERERMADAATLKASQLAQLNAALGDDAIRPDDYTIVLPPRALRSRAALVALGAELEGLLVGAYLNGVENAQDGATRLLLGRLLAADVQQLAWLRTLGGALGRTEVPVRVSVERAGARFDDFLATPGVAPG